MKKKAIELNVDFIGGQEGPLTKAEEQAISEYIKTQKMLKVGKRTTKSGGRARNRVAA